MDLTPRCSCRKPIGVTKTINPLTRYLLGRGTSGQTLVASSDARDRDALGVISRVEDLGDNEGVLGRKIRIFTQKKMETAADSIASTSYGAIIEELQ